MTKDTEDTKVLIVFFTSVSAGKICVQEFQDSKACGKILSKEDLAWVEADQVREHLNKQGIWWHAPRKAEGTG